MTPETLPPAADRPDPANHRRPATSTGYGFPPPLTPAQIASRRSAEEVLANTYPGQDVAFIDTWNGDTLDRVVVVASADPTVFVAKIRQLDSEVQRRIDVTSVPDPDEVDVPSAEFA